jgi:putative IMPACT (imprinted ancient) family translation regulator
VNAVWHDHSEGDDIVILGTTNLDANKYIQLSDGRVVLDEYDYIKITTETGSTMSVILSMEILQNTAYQNGA